MLYTLGILIFLICILIAAVLAHDIDAAARRDAYKKVAAHFNGKTDHKGARVVIDGINVRYDQFDIINDAPEPWHRVTIRMQGQPRRLLVDRETAIVSKVEKAFGAQDIEVGHERYDHLFVVKSDDPPWVRAHLHTEIFERHSKLPTCRLSLEKDTLCLQSRAHNYKLETILPMIELAVLYAQACAPTKPLPAGVA